MTKSPKPAGAAGSARSPGGDTDDSREMLEALPAAVCRSDAAGRLTYFNSAFGELWGWVPELGKDRWWEPWKLFHGDGSPMPLEASPLMVALREGRPLAAAQLMAERLDGRRVWWELQSTVLRDASGNVAGGLHVLADITHRKQDEARVRAEAERVQLVADAVPALISYIDADARYQLNNRGYEKWFGHCRESVRGRHMREVLGETAWEVIRPHVEAALAGQVVTYEQEVPYRDGGTRWIRATYTPELDQAGNVRGFVAHVNDITAQKRAEQDLRRSETRVVETLESISDGCLAVDAQWRFTYVNAAAERVVGMSRDEMLGRTWQEIFPPAIGSQLEHELRRCMQQRVPVELENFYPPWQRWFLCRAYPTPDGGHAQYFQEITERKRAEQALRDSEALLQSVLQQMPLAIGVMDKSGTWMIANPRMRELAPLAIPSTQSEQLARWTLTTDEGTIVPPQDWPGQRVLRGESIVPGLDALYTDGEGRQRWKRITAAPLRNADGQFIGATCVIQDIDAIKRAKDDIARSRDALVRLIEQCPFGIYIVDSDFTIFTMNQRSLEGPFINVRPVIGRAFDEAIRIIWPADVAEEVIRIFRHTLETGEAFHSSDFIHRRADKEQVEGYEWELHQITLPDGDKGVICYYFDSTELRKAEQAVRESEEALREADRRKDEFLATLAHELRNPLAPIRSGLEVLKLVEGAPAIIHEIRATMERQTEQLVRLIDDLLDVSRITRGNLKLQIAQCDLKDIVQSAVEATRPAIDEKGHQLTVNLPPERIVLEVDRHRLAQVLSNLLHNAAKYSPQPGPITLTARHEGSDIVLSVTDRGLGIPEDKRQEIFQMFAQIGRSAHFGYTGLGIGLTVAKSLVEMHGGRIEVDSAGPDQGSQFVVRIPHCVKHIEHTAGNQGGPEDRQPLAKQRVLVVDDNQDAARMLSLTVALLGCDVRVAHDGQEALGVAADFHPDVVLLDLGMPRMSGYEAAEHIRQAAWGKNLVLVALTGWGQEEDRRKTTQAGFDHHLTKPADPAVLKALLAAAK